MLRRFVAIMDAVPKLGLADFDELRLDQLEVDDVKLSHIQLCDIESVS